ncbi:unnamed protein product [Fusarium graminearum]|nr:unnamed protein product [Fusarium graminearum]
MFDLSSVSKKANTLDIKPSAPSHATSVTADAKSPHLSNCYTKSKPTSPLNDLQRVEVER